MIGFEVLEGHGVPTDQVELLKARLGPGFPRKVEGPNSAVEWTFEVMPWSSVVPVLRGWLEKGFKRGGIENESLARKVLEQIKDPPDYHEAVWVAGQVDALVATVCKVRGLEVEPDDEDPEFAEVVKKLPVEFRAWVAAAAAMTAVIEASRDGGVIGTEWARWAWGAVGWGLSQVEAEANNRVMVENELVQDAVGALTKYLGSWVGSWAEL
jgi:hypothetical protein